MAPSKKHKAAPTRKSARIQPPKPVPEEEEESSQSEASLPLRITLPAAKKQAAAPAEDSYDEDEQIANNELPLEPEDEQSQEDLDADDKPDQEVVDRDSSEDEESEEDEDEEKDGEEEEEEEREVAPIVPTKRKAKKSPTKKSATNKKKVRKPDTDSDNELNIVEEPVILKISYTITTLTLQELKKTAARRKPRSHLIELASDLEWVDAKAHLKIIICDLLFPSKAVVADDCYEMTWSIMQVVPTPLSLGTEADYQLLVKKSLKAKEPAVKITVEELEKAALPADGQENIPPAPAAVPLPAQAAPIAATQNDVQPKPKPKSKAQKEADILPGNVAINEKIKQLRLEWECNMSKCASEFCFIPAEVDHFPLSMDHIEKWAAAILAEEATLKAPPNHCLFNAVSSHKIVSKSPLLQARLNARANQQALAAPAGPVVNVVLPSNPYGLYQDFSGNFAPLLTQGNICSTTSEALKSLIPADHIEGQQMDLDTFCAVYCVPKSIKEQLEEHEVTGTHAFVHMSTDDIHDMGFKIGQTIDLKEAIKKWVQAK